MHELSLAQAVVDAVAAHVGAGRAVRVRLEIGRLSGVVVDSIRFCFDLVADGTAVAGAALDIEEPAGRCRCRTCGSGFETGDPIVLCPSCDGADVAVLSGRQLRVLTVEVKPACAPPAAAPTPPVP
jgi:hydrogenase nickel incorporation protein HypA/HybF